MYPIIQLTYIFILKYNIVGFRKYPEPTPMNLVRAQLKSEKYNIRTTDVMNFMVVNAGPAYGWWEGPAWKTR